MLYYARILPHIPMDGITPHKTAPAAENTPSLHELEWRLGAQNARYEALRGEEKAILAQIEETRRLITVMRLAELERDAAVKEKARADRKTEKAARNFELTGPPTTRGELQFWGYRGNAARMTPSLLDEQRLTAFVEREEHLEEYKTSKTEILAALENRIWFDSQGGEKRIQEMQDEIQKNKEEWPLRIFGVGKRALASKEKERDYLMDHSDLEPTEELRERLQRVEQLIHDEKTESYDPSLHEVEGKKVLFLSGDNQSVYLTRQMRGDRLITLHLPRTPAEQDFKCAITLNLNNDTDLSDFVSLLGEDLPKPSSLPFTLTQALQNRHFYNEFLPCPLEVVEFNGEKRFRLPQVFWDRFSGSIVRT